MLDEDQNISLSTDTLNEDQIALLDGYNKLNDGGKKVIMALIGQLNFVERPKIMRMPAI